jgi:hypothetical protein
MIQLITSNQAKSFEPAAKAIEATNLGQFGHLRKNSALEKKLGP